MHLSHCIFWLILPATVPVADPLTAKLPAHPVAAVAGPAIRQSTPSAFSEQTFQRFVSMYEKGIAEKLYLQLDKPYYSAGENIWIKGYLVNAVTLAPMRQRRRKRTMHRRNRFHRFGEKAHCKSKTHLPACIGRQNQTLFSPNYPTGKTPRRIPYSPTRHGVQFTHSHHRRPKHAL